MEFCHNEDQEDVQEEEIIDQSIFVDYIPSTIHVLDRVQTTQRFLTNRNNKWQKPSLNKQILHPAPIHVNEKSDVSNVPVSKPVHVA